LRFWKSWLIARKEFDFIRIKKSALGISFGLPIGLGILLPLITYLEITRKKVPIEAVTPLMGSFAFYFIIIAALIPVYTSVSSIVVEKIERSLEPLLATPTSDREILVGKYIATFVLTIVGTYIGAAIFVTLMDTLTRSSIGYFYFPNTAFDIALFAAAPAASIFSTAFGVLSSSRVTTIQSAQSLSVVPLIPLIIIYLTGELDLINLNDTSILAYVAIGLAVAAAIVFQVSTAVFDREEILTRWK
jgi:ABC-type Na+ efflux pump permease subunit